VKLYLTFEQVAEEWKEILERSLKVDEKAQGTYKKYTSNLKQLMARFGDLMTVEVNDRMTLLRRVFEHAYMKSEFIFCNQYGEPWKSSEHIMRQVWTPTLKKLGIAYRIIYQCRHTHASLSILAGDNLAHIAERMGHKNVGTLITRYAKYVESVQMQRSNIGAFLGEENENMPEYSQNKKDPITK